MMGKGKLTQKSNSQNRKEELFTVGNGCVSDEKSIGVVQRGKRNARHSLKSRVLKEG